MSVTHTVTPFHTAKCPIKKQPNKNASTKQFFLFNPYNENALHTHWFCECVRIIVVSQMYTHCCMYDVHVQLANMSFFSLLPDVCMMVQCYNWGKTCVRADHQCNALTLTENCNSMFITHNFMQYASLFNEFWVWRECISWKIVNKSTDTFIQILQFFMFLLLKPKFNISAN